MTLLNEFQYEQCWQFIFLNKFKIDIQFNKIIKQTNSLLYIPMNQQIYSFSHDQLLNYLDQLSNQNREGNEKEALKTLVDVVLLKRNQWSGGLQKLMHRYFDMSFEQNDHSNLTKMLKEYRSVTQTQYSDSLNDVLLYFRDKKLEKVLQESIETEKIQNVKSMGNIEDEESIGDLILESFKTKQKEKQNQLKNQMRVVWNGYKAIIQTVKSNSKLEELYIKTLEKLFSFAEKYNRKQEFKEFCKNFRYGLHNILGKKNILNEAQKTMYTDYEKTDVNERNVQIRFQQFDVALKLGLWQSSFQIIEDINELLNIRKGIIKRSTLSKYYLNLSKLFKKSRYWNYFAFAYYNYYNIYSRNPKIDHEELQNITNTLLLSILAIPPFSSQTNQTIESQKKISNLLAMTNKVPSKSQLYELIIEKGILQHASSYVRDLWTFIFVDFNLLDVPQKLSLLKQLKEFNKEFSELIEDSIINQQILQISKIYTKIKMSNFYKIIPFNKDQVLNRLLSTNQNADIQFKYDEVNDTVEFKQKSEERTAYSELNRINKQIAILTEKISTGDKAFILKKIEDLLANGTQFYQIRKSKIEEFSQKLKKPRKEAKDEEAKQIQREKRAKQMQEGERKIREEEQKAKDSQKQKELTQKKNLIKEIIKIKDRRVIRIEGKVIEQLDDRDLDNLTVEDIDDIKKQTEKKNKQDTQNKYRKAFIKTDYIERQRRQRIIPSIKTSWVDNQNEISKIIEKSKQNFEAKTSKKQYLVQLKDQITEQMSTGRTAVTKKYEQDMANYQLRVTKQFKERIIQKAKELKKLAQETRVKQEEERKKKQGQRLQREKEESQNPFFIRRSNIPSAYSTSQAASNSTASTTAGWRNTGQGVTTTTQAVTPSTTSTNTAWRNTGQVPTQTSSNPISQPTAGDGGWRSNKPAQTTQTNKGATQGNNKASNQGSGWRKKN